MLKTVFKSNLFIDKINQWKDFFMKKKEVQNKNIIGNIIVVSIIISMINTLMFIGDPNNITSLFITFLSLFISGVSLLINTIRNFNDNVNSKYIIIEKEEYNFLINDIRKKEKTIKEQNKLIKHLANKKL